MISNVFHAVFFLPLYNALVWLSAVLPGADIGLAIVVLTLLVKIALFPLQHRVNKTQRVLKQLEPKLQELKEKHADNRAEHAKKMMELYKEHGVNPFSGFLVLLIQLPILLALFWVFKDSFLLKPEWIYSFVTVPAITNTIFLGFLDIAARSYVLAVFVGLSQFLQIRLMSPALAPVTDSKNHSLAADFSRTLNLQMRYTMPVIITFVAISLPAALSLYWLTSNLFAIGHELVINRQFRKSHAS